MSPTPSGPVSVVIPAHNEATVIGRCLSRLLSDAAPGELDIVVVCNGCDDATAQVARQTAPTANVIELPQPSKVAALNTGDMKARFFPRFYLDADVELSTESLRRTVEVLRQPGVLCAAPRPLFDLDRRPWRVRAFYKVWARIPYITEDLVGSGVYALSEEGRARFSSFPQLVNDDQYVALLFERGERRSVPDAHFVVQTPTKLAGLVAIRARAYRGNNELESSGLSRATPPRSGAWTAVRLLGRPLMAPSVAVYLSVNMAARLRARGRSTGKWERDETARAFAGTHVQAKDKRDGGGENRVNTTEATPAICYVTSQYPALSHTFVMREVLGLRSAGLQISTVSVHKASPEHLLAEIDKREAETTWSIFPLNYRTFLTYHWDAARLAPKAYLATLGRALKVSPPGPLRRLWQLFYFAEAIALWGHAAHLGVRHLHAHLANVGADLCWLATEYANLADPDRPWRWSFTMHGPTEFYATERYNLARKVANADAVLCISDFARSQLMYLSEPSQWDKLAVVHMGVELERYPFVAPLEHAGLSVLSVARLVPAKGLQLLIDAVATLARRGHDVNVVIAGEGPLLHDLEERARHLGVGGRVRLLGAVGQDQMARLYAEADVFCLPSFAEGVPVVLMEAMATGRPVVASSIAGVPELVEDGLSGLLVPPGNMRALADALETLASAPELRSMMGSAGRQKVEEDFDSLRCAEQAAQLFRRLFRPR